MAVTAGEAIGFAVAAAIAIGTVMVAMPEPWRHLVVIAGGSVEGALLGAAQIVGMGARRPEARAWIGSTAVGAAIAWSIGMLPSTVGLEFAAPLGVLMIAVGALVLLASLPVVQWLTIRHRQHALRWIFVNMGAWAIAVLWTFAPSPIVDESTPLGVLIAVYVVAGLLMAGTVAALTATTARRLFG